MLRRLRVLAAFFMVPVVLLAPSNPAAALGDWYTVEIAVPASGWSGDSIPSSVDTIDCAFSLQQTGTYSINLGTGFCIGLPDVTWGYPQPGESGAGYSITLNGLSAATGSSCSGSMSSTFGQHPKNGTVRVAGTITPGEIAVSASDCAVTEVCLDLGGAGANLCVTVDVPPYADETETGEACPAGTPHAYLSVERELDGSYALNKVMLNWSVVGNTVDSARQWGAFVFGHGSASSSAVGPLGTESGKVKLREFWGMASDPVPTYPSAGIEFYAYLPEPTGQNQYWNDTIHDYRGANVPDSFPLNASSSYFGITDGSQCRFYFGPKAVDDPTSDQDEPFGDSDDPNPPAPVDPTDPGPSPVLEEPVVPEEPDTDEGWLGPMWALLDWLKRWLNRLWEWVQNLGTWLKGLVVPEADYLEGKWDGVDAKWANTTPAKYVDELSSFSPGSVSGCAGVPLQVTLPGGVGIDERLGAACSGEMATSASVVRAAITAMVVVGGAFACVRALGAGLGWNPGVGRVEP